MQWQIHSPGGIDGEQEPAAASTAAVDEFAGAQCIGLRRKPARSRLVGLLLNANTVLPVAAGSEIAIPIAQDPRSELHCKGPTQHAQAPFAGSLG